MVTKIKVKDFECCCRNNSEASNVTYLIYPALVPFAESWIDKTAEQYKVALVVVYVPADKWNDVLTPWSEPGEAKGFPPFAGEASEFLKFLKSEIIPATEKQISVSDDVPRDLIGVSLSGLFTVWQWILCDTFRNIASLSGSFWYNGFIEWFEKQKLPAKTGKAFFLLGEEEPKAHIKAYRSVGEDTEKVVTRFKDAGIQVTFDWVPGNHFSQPVHRAELAFKSLYSV